MERNGRFEPVDTRQYPMSVRVLFAFDEDKDPSVWVKAKTHIEMVAPTTPVPLPEQAAGTWVQLCDEEGRVLFHRIVYAALFPRLDEVEDADGNLTTVESPTPRGEFEVLLPLMDEAHHGDLVRSPPRPDIERQVVTFTLDAQKVPS